MKMKKCGIILSTLACVGMLSYGVLTAQAAVMATCPHSDWELVVIGTGRYESTSEGHYEKCERFLQCVHCPESTTPEIVDGPLEAHQFTVYAGDPFGSWVEECDICYYHVEYNP